MVQIPYTLGPGISSDPYHVGVLGTQLTRNMHTVIPAVRAELIAAFGDMIPKSEISGQFALCIQLAGLDETY